MSLMSIEISEKGVQRVVSKPTSIAEATKAAEISAKTAFVVRMLHETIAGDDKDAIPMPTSEHGYLFIPRGEIDGDWLEFEQAALSVPPAPRELFSDPAPWIVGAMKRAYPRHTFWGDAQGLEGGEQEAAVMILSNHRLTNDGFLDHAGWVDDEKRGVLLVSEPFVLGPNEIEDLQSLCQNAGLEYRIVGFSNHYPSRTVRIEVWKAI